VAFDKRASALPYSADIGPRTISLRESDWLSTSATPWPGVVCCTEAPARLRSASTTVCGAAAAISW
jgi:hypothetical protein